MITFNSKTICKRKQNNILKAVFVSFEQTISVFISSTQKMLIQNLKKKKTEFGTYKTNTVHAFHIITQALKFCTATE